ncbi:MFS transporter [Micrococcoides hystricis]|uniref:MFS transporter n=1 Tax=Micrococcoides hystricis TaxID=1572761 RepID=A0ABV6PAR6_9MICC
MSFRSYGVLLQKPQIRSLMVLGFLARFPHTALGIVLTLHVVLHLGLSYTQAGAAAAILTVGIAVGSPWRGRRVDLVGLRKALIPSVIAESLIWAIAPHLSYEWLLVAAFVGGLLALPIFTIVRQSLGALTTGDQRRSAFALDAIITETVFMVGPAAGAVLATMWSSVWTLTCIGLWTSLAGLALMWSNPPVRSVPTAAEREAFEEATGSIPMIDPTTGAVRQEQLSKVTGFSRRLQSRFSWFNGVVLAVFISAFGCGLIFSGSDVSIVAVLEAQGEAGKLGIVYLFWSGASVVGGLIYGAQNRQLNPAMLMLGLAILVMPLALVTDVWTLALLSLGAGLLTAPTLAAASEWLTEAVPERSRGEAMGYYGSALTAGAALGAPWAGIAIDAVSPSSGFVAVAAFSIALATVGLLGAWRRRRAQQNTVSE